MDVIVDAACSIGECMYAHMSYEYQRFAAVYTACLLYVDDLGSHISNAMEQFGQRLLHGKSQVHPVLERLASLLKTAHELYPRISADTIFTNTIDGINAMHIEVVSKGKGCSALAAKYPTYLRLRSGIASGYAHLSFVKTMEGVLGTSYLQLLPYVWLMSTASPCSYTSSLSDLEIVINGFKYVFCLVLRCICNTEGMGAPRLATCEFSNSSRSPVN